MARLELHALTRWITAVALARPDQLDADIMARTGVSRRTARRALKSLVALGWLANTGTARRPAYRAGALRQVIHRYALDGLAEDRPWAQDFAPCFAFPAAVNRMVQHAFSELLNNAIDHSGGTHVTVSLRQTAGHAQLLVSDNGHGLFQRLAESFGLDDPQQAMLELSKGKLTSQPDRHSGQGLFFTAQLADVFDLHANEAAFQRRDWQGGGWHPQRALKHEGTSVYAAFALDTTRTLAAVREAHSAGGLGVGFDRTRVPLRLMTSAVTGLESRAQARRVAARLAEFHCADLDFDGIADVGHAFTDELFRVLARTQPALVLAPMNMNARVAAMVDSVRGNAAQPGQLTR